MNQPPKNYPVQSTSRKILLYLRVANKIPFFTRKAHNTNTSHSTYPSIPPLLMSKQILRNIKMQIRYEKRISEQIQRDLESNTDNFSKFQGRIFRVVRTLLEQAYACNNR